MAGVAHTPHLEKRPSGYAFRRRIPAGAVEISNLDQSSALCLSLRTDVLSEARPLVRALTALTDLGFAMMTERRMAHLGANSLTLLTELARCQIALHEESRAMADPRSEDAANAAAAAERATQAVLRRALALGDRELARDPLRAVAAELGIALDDSTSEWRALAHEALKVLVDVSCERERREIGQYREPTPIFRSVMSGRSASEAAVLPAVPTPTPVQSRTVPAAARCPRHL